jgi:hypothetical protein
MTAKSILSSTTFWGALGSLIIGYSSIIGKVALDGETFTSRDLELLVTMTVTTLVTIIGRVNAKDFVYTPYLLPGPNKEDLVSTLVSQAKDQLESKIKPPSP